MTACLTDLDEARSLQFSFDLAKGKRFHAARMSTSRSRTWGTIVATGGEKCSSRASLRFSRASSSFAPWLATSTWTHCAMNHSPSCQMLAENRCLMAKSYHTSATFKMQSRPSSLSVRSGAAARNAQGERFTIRAKLKPLAPCPSNTFPVEVESPREGLP